MAKEALDTNLLLEQLHRGDETAFRKLFEDFYASLCLFATQYLNDRDEAADIVQESFLKYWNRHADFDDYRKIKSFLYVVVRHACLNQLRSKHLRAQVTDENFREPDQVFYNRMMEEEAHRLFNSAIDSLPPQMQMVINYALDGFKNSEIAQKMNLSEGSVHQYKKEAYKKLRDSLKEHYYLMFVFLFLTQ